MKKKNFQSPEMQVTQLHRDTIVQTSTTATRATYGEAESLDWD